MSSTTNWETGADVTDFQTNVTWSAGDAGHISNNDIATISHGENDFNTDKVNHSVDSNDLDNGRASMSTAPFIRSALRSRNSLCQRQYAEAKSSAKHARKISQHNFLTLFLWNTYSAIAVFATILITMESIVGCALTVGAILVTHYSVSDDDSSSSSATIANEWNGTMDSVLLSFAVITPLSSSISMAFARRESALRALATYRSAVFNLYMAHVSWDWGESGKKTGRRGCVEIVEDEKKAQFLANTAGLEKYIKEMTPFIPSAVQPPKDTVSSKTISVDDSANCTEKYIQWLHHGDMTLRHLVHLSDSLHHYLTLPTATRARHRVTAIGKQEARTVLNCGRSLFTLNVSGRMVMISQLCEALKYRGLPGNEASRIRQWENFMTNAMEELRVVKEYRTPQALRSFGRLFTLFLPPLYAPSYSQVARDTNSLALGIVLGVVTSLALTGLFECLRQLEDPFVAHVTLDGIDVREELVVLAYQELMVARGMIFPMAETFQLKKKDGYERDGEDNVTNENKSESHAESVDRTSKHATQNKKIPAL